MSGPAPDLPTSGWKVSHQSAFRRWLESDPPTLLVTPVIEWIKACELLGPPADAKELGSDRCLAPVAGTSLTVEYLLVEFEFRLIIREIR